MANSPDLRPYNPLEGKYNSDKPLGVTSGIKGIGRQLVELAAESGTAPIIVLARRLEAAISLYRGNPRITVIPGDLTDPESLKRFTDKIGNGVVVNTAACLNLTNRNELEAVNVRGTANLLRAAEESGVRKIVGVGSVAEYSATDSLLVDENAIRASRMPYGQSKIAAAKILFGQSAVIPIEIMPTDVIGEYMDVWTRKMIAQLKKGINPFRLNRQTTIPVVDQRNVADLILLAAQDDKANGKSYLAVDNMIPLSELFDYYAQALKIPALPVPMPYPLLQVVASGARKYAEMSSGHDHLIDMTNVLVTKRVVSSANAEKDLGWTHRRSVADSVNAVVLYDRQQAYENAEWNI